MGSWAALEDELAAWEATGHRPQLWWRDDDAQAATAALEHLLTLSQRHAVPVHLAVIPKGLHPDLPARLRDADDVFVLQHGLSHTNHAPNGSPASEVGADRDLALQRADLAQGWRILEDSAMPRLLRGFAPPWNRIGDATRRQLPKWGYNFLSAYEGRGETVPVAGLTHIDANLDPVRWKHGHAFRGEGAMLEMLMAHLRKRRVAWAMSNPIGYITHHLQTGADIWAFTDRLFAATRGLWVTVPQMQKDG